MPGNRLPEKITKNELIHIAGIYPILALINLRVKLLLTPSWFGGELAGNHQKLLQFAHTNNEQSRILQFYVPELLIGIFNLSIPDAYLLQRWFFTTMAFICFHIFLKKYFDRGLAFACVFFLSAVMPLTYYDHLQESSPLLFLTFLLGLWTIRENSLFLLMLILLVGAMNNETMLILPLVLFLYKFRTRKLSHLIQICLTSIAVGLPAFIYTGIIRYITRDQPHLGGYNHLFQNFIGVIIDLLKPPIDYWKALNLYPFFLFGIFWVLAWRNIKDKPLFLRRASLMVPVFFFIHFYTGIILEIRQLLPLGFIIIPMAMMHISEYKNKQ